VSNLTVALLGGGGAMLGWGSADFFAKKTIDVIGDLATLFWGQVVGAIVLACVVVQRGHALHYAASAWVALAVFGLVSGWSYLLLYRGFARGQVSVLSPIFAAYAGVAALGAAVVFNEPLPTVAKFGLAVSFIGILLMATDTSELRTLGRKGSGASGGVPEVLVAMLVFAGWLIFWDRFLSNRDWIPSTFVMRSVACLGLVAFAIAFRKSLLVPNRSMWTYLAAIGLCDVGAFSAISYGFSHSSLGSIVALLSGAFSLPTLVLARIFLKERLVLAQGIAAGLIISGVALVAVSG
jgi:drug/metabolite transporter (DMT)-like permease